jgi:hypothetical protein
MYMDDREFLRFLDDEDRRASMGARGDFEEEIEEAPPDLTDEEIAELESQADWDDLMRERDRLP